MTSDSEGGSGPSARAEDPVVGIGAELDTERAGQPAQDERNSADEDRQLYFDQLAAVKNSILEGVITYW
jgi:hypothetical protein